MESDRAILCCLANYSGISIHALQAESDLCQRFLNLTYRNFNPRSPSGERLLSGYQSMSVHSISIHTLQAESDVIISLYLGNFSIFQSTLSKRRATQYMQHSQNPLRFQSTLSKRRATEER